MICEQCGGSMEPDEMREYGGKQICEDCYIDALTPAKSCDPWANYTASRLDTQELTPAQEAIMGYIDEHGEGSLEQITAATGLSEKDFQREFATLHHMDIAGAALREGNKKVFVRLERKG